MQRFVFGLRTYQLATLDCGVRIFFSHPFLSSRSPFNIPPLRRVISSSSLFSFSLLSLCFQRVCFSHGFKAHESHKSVLVVAGEIHVLSLSSLSSNIESSNVDLSLLFVQLRACCISKDREEAMQYLKLGSLTLGGWGYSLSPTFLSNRPV